jgi:hypothetical protein
MPATTRRISAKLGQLPAGQPVGYADFLHEPAEFGAVAAALSRLSKREGIKTPSQRRLLPAHDRVLRPSATYGGSRCGGRRSYFWPASPLPAYASVMR